MIDACDPAQEIPSPESVVSLFNAELGLLPTGFRRNCRAAPYRPGDQRHDLNLEATRTQAEFTCGHVLDDSQLASYLMYPTQTVEHFEHVRKNSDITVLPAPAFFCGLQSREDVAIDIAKGKTWLITMQGRLDDADEGMVNV